MRPQGAAERFETLEASEARALRLCLQLSVIALIWALGLVTLGAIVSVTDSAHDCSGWPLCNGQLSPAADVNGVLIFGHRFGGLALVLLSTAFVAVSYLRLRSEAAVTRLAASVFVLILAQAVLGGFAVVRDLSSAVVTAHLILALIVIAALTASAVIIWRRISPNAVTAPVSTLALPPRYSGYLRAMGLVLLMALISGSIVGSPVEITGCSNPGQCLEQVSNSFSSAGGFMSFHYISAILGVTVAGAFLYEAQRDRALNTVARKAALVAGSTLALALILGAVLTFIPIEDAWLATPLAIASLSWVAIVGLVTADCLALRDKPAARTPIKETLRDFARVTKPGIMLLLEVTTLGAMLIAAQGWPSLELVLLTLLGGAMAAGGASALNCYYDRDIDGLMARTRKRPIPTGSLTSDQVRVFGLVLSVLAVIELAWFVNPLAATMALAGNLFYVLVYTRKLKRTTPQNIVIGGAAGSFPPLVGWAAVTGSLSLGALLIAAIIFYWTPPHFWSLALLKANDYRRAGIPMLPVTHGEHETRRRILLYSLLLVAVTLLMVPAGVVGWIYGVTAGILGGWFVIMALRMFREDTSRLAWPLFKYSNYYLAALLAAMAVDHAFI
ncbi:MAG: protoheme IX farnesyltransferase [Chloroflexia bacterium]|nr:protoheme IX farnesyltransferase [Chloroflexia bacterium]